MPQKSDDQTPMVGGVMMAIDAIVRTNDGHRYEAVTDADYHIETASGVKLRALPNTDGMYAADALGLCTGVDAAAQFTRISNLGISSISIPHGKTIKLDTVAIVSNTDFTLVGGGTLDCSGGGELVIIGTHTALPMLAADTPPGARTLTFTAPHGLTSGQVIALWDNRVNSAGLARPYYCEGWRGVVATVDSATSVTVYGRITPALSSTYTHSARVEGGSVALHGFHVIANPTDLPPIKIQRRNFVRYSDIKTPAGSGYTNLNISQCYDVHISDPRSTALNGDAYPVSISSSQKIILEKVTACFSPRHAEAIGGGGLADDGQGNTASRDISVIGSYLVSSGVVGAGDLHGGTFEANFTNCTFDPNVTLGGGNHELNDCTIIGTDGRCVRLTELDGGYVRFNNCRFITYEGNDVEGAVFLLTNMLRRDTELTFNNCLWDHRGSATDIVRPILVSAGLNGDWDASTGSYPPATQGDMFEVTVQGVVAGVMRNVGEYYVYSSYGGGVFHKSNKPKVRVTVRNARITGLSDYLLFTALTGTQIMDDRFTLDIDHVAGGHGSYFWASRAEHSANCKMRLPAQTITWDTVSTAIADIISPMIDTNWVYPRVPNAQASWCKTSAGLISSTEANAVCQAGDVRETGTQLYLRKADGLPFAPDIPLRLTGKVWIDDQL